MRRFIAVFLSLVLLLTMSSGSAFAKQNDSREFKDINGNFGYLSILKMQSFGILAGYEDGTFRPNNPLTQAELAVIIDKLLQMQQGTQDDDSLDDEDGFFKDVPGWAKIAVAKGAHNNYLNMKRFHSNVQVDRLTAAVALAKALKLSPITDGSLNPFKDRGIISDEDYSYLLALYQAGYIKGFPDGNFNPNGLLRRAEIAKIIDNILDGVTSNDDTTDPVWTTTAALTVSPSAVTNGSITLAWPDASDNVAVTQYKLYQNAALIMTLDSDANEVTVSGLTDGATYLFMVKALDAAGNDSYGLRVTYKE